MTGSYFINKTVSLEMDVDTVLQTILEEQGPDAILEFLAEHVNSVKHEITGASIYIYSIEVD